MAIKLIVGLSNPGVQYQFNRHNIGAIFVDYIAKQLGQNFSNNTAFFGQVSSVIIADCKVRLLKPSTYMNRSGQSVQAVMNFYKIKADEVLIIHDELDLPLATTRLKTSGGHGGHNGLRDIIAKIGTPDFHRLRMGIGRPPQKMAVADFILQDFSKQQDIQMHQAILEAYNVFDKVVVGDISSAMLALHTN